jgi:L-lactate dehydrogenase complex protein LldE
LRKDFAALLPRVYELSEFLIDRLGVEDVGAYFPHRVTYHASCHGVRGAAPGRPAFKLMAKVRGLELIPLPNVDRCCGFGGTFSSRTPRSPRPCWPSSCRTCLTGAEYCTALDNSCLMHLGGAMHRQYAA